MKNKQNMNNFKSLKQLVFVLELLIVSVLLSYLVKYGGRYLFISATSSNVLLIVLIPAIVMAIALLSRYLLATKQHQQ